MKVIKIIKNIFFHKPPTLGRWRLKHNEQECHDYIINIHAEPGYPSSMKKIWIARINRKK